MKTTKCRIKPNDKSFIGQKIVVSHGGGTTVATIIAITSERAIWVSDDDGKEDWTWLCPNRQFISFDVIHDGKFNSKFIKAITLENYVRDLKKENNRLAGENAELQKYKKLVDIIQENSKDY